jgi:hypothetical protein
MAWTLAVNSDGEAARRGGQREDRGQRAPDPGLVEVDPPDPRGPDLGGCRKLVEEIVGDERDRRSPGSW